MSEVDLHLSGGGRSFCVRGEFSVTYRTTTAGGLSPFSSARRADSAPVHRITLHLGEWSGKSGTWGDLKETADREEKLQALAHAVRERSITRHRPAFFEHGEYSEEGRYGPLPVVVHDVQLPTEARGDQPAELTLVEVSHRPGQDQRAAPGGNNTDNESNKR
jgi:hypothetical protein